MKIYVNYDENNHDRIRGVQTVKYYIDKGKTQKEIDVALEEANAKAGYKKFKCFDVSEDMVNIFRFALGEGEYKTYKDMTYLYDMLRDINDNLEGIQRDCCDVCDSLENSLNKVMELIPEGER